MCACAQTHTQICAQIEIQTNEQDKGREEEKISHSVTECHY